MPSKLELKRNLETAIKSGHLGSGGMRVLHCRVDIDDIGKISVSITLNPGGLPREGVEGLVETAFGSVGIAGFVKDGKWEDINVDHGSGTTTVTAYGFM